jgi:hypothetical protein
MHCVSGCGQVLASNAIFLGLVALVPFTLGRLVLSIASRLVVATAANDFGLSTTVMVPTADLTYLHSRGEKFGSNTTMLNWIGEVSMSTGASGGHLWDVGNNGVCIKTF